MPGAPEIDRLVRLLQGSSRLAAAVGRSGGLRVLPLHGGLPAAVQSRVFDRPPPGVLKVVVATNVAETSLTIDDVTVVVDTGRHKEMRWGGRDRLIRQSQFAAAKSVVDWVLCKGTGLVQRSTLSMLHVSMYAPPLPLLLAVVAPCPTAAGGASSFLLHVLANTQRHLPPLLPTTPPKACGPPFIHLPTLSSPVSHLYAAMTRLVV